MDVENTQNESSQEPRTPKVSSPPIQSRFLFVDVAAMRAKQLRRGALPRLGAAVAPGPNAYRPEAPHKPERIAMEEVRRGLVEYQLPIPKGTGAGGEK